MTYRLRAGDWHKAIGIAAKFSQLGAHKAAITRAQSALLEPASTSS